MNVLPLVSALILVFGICSYTFFYNTSAAIEEEKHFNGAHQITRQFSNRLQRATYQKMKGDLVVGQKKASQSNASTFCSHRDQSNLSSSGKLNIAPLFDGADTAKKKRLFCILIRNLYEHTAVYRQDLEEDLFQILCVQNQASDPILLLQEHPELYKLIKGTHSYRIGTSRGYPALGDYLTKEQKRKMVNASQASRPVLEALMGKSLAAKIINEEKHKWESSEKVSPLTKNELEAFLLSQRKNLHEFAPLLDFSALKQSPTQEVFWDKTSNIQLKIPK